MTSSLYLAFCAPSRQTCRNSFHQGRRFFSVTHHVKADSMAASSIVGKISPPKRPIGGFRGGIIGFLFGFSVASAFAAYRLLDEYKQASAMLQASVLELQLSTENVTAHVRRIEAIEKDLKMLRENSANKEEVSRVRAEMKKVFDGLHVEFLDLKAHVWGLEQDLHSLSKKENGTVRIQ